MTQSQFLHRVLGVGVIRLGIAGICLFVQAVYPPSMHAGGAGNEVPPRETWLVCLRCQLWRVDVGDSRLQREG